MLKISHLQSTKSITKIKDPLLQNFINQNVTKYIYFSNQTRFDLKSINGI